MQYEWLKWHTDIFLVPEIPVFMDTVAKYGIDDKKLLIDLDVKFSKVVSENNE